MTQIQHTLPWSMKELYDLLMYDIEPDLVSSNIPLLDARHANESSNAKQLRYQKYAKAAEEFQERFTECMRIWSEKMTDFQKEQFSILKTASNDRDENNIDQLEKLIDSL